MMRISDRLGKISRQPTQVRWGTCLRLPFFTMTWLNTSVTI